MQRRSLLQAALASAAASATWAAPVSIAHASAAPQRIRIAQQFGIAYLVLDVIRHHRLIEKHATLQGSKVDVEWIKISGATAMNEALLAGNIDIASAGTPPALVMWDRTRGRHNVKLVASLGSQPGYVITNAPHVHTLSDLTDKDRIAVPAAGVGYQSRTLQIEAAKLFGKARLNHFDKITVSLPHPDATAALISGKLEVNTHFSSAPFYYQAMQANPSIRKIASSYDILGGPSAFTVLYATEKFHHANRQAYAAFHAALLDASAWIAAHPDAAVDVFIAEQKSKLDPALLRRIVNDPDNQFSVVPERTYIYAERMHEMGVLQHKPTDWKDYFFPEMHDQAGS